MPNCMKMHHLKWRITKIFWGGGTCPQILEMPLHFSIQFHWVHFYVGGWWCLRWWLLWWWWQFAAVSQWTGATIHAGLKKRQTWYITSSYTNIKCHNMTCTCLCIAKRLRDASCLSVVSFIASIVQYLERRFFIITVTSASDLPVCTIRFCSIVFGITLSLAVIPTIHGRPWLCNVYSAIACLVGLAL